MSEAKRKPGRPRKHPAPTPDIEDEAPAKAAKRLPDPVRLDRVAFLKSRLRMLNSDQAAARASSSWVAVRQLGQDIDTSHKELRELERVADEKQQTPEQQLAEFVALIGDPSDGFPLWTVETIYMACCERMGISHLREVG